MPVAKKQRFPRVTAVPLPYMLYMVTLLYRTLQSTLGYDTVIRRTWVAAVSKNFAFKIAAKPLQTDTIS